MRYCPQCGHRVEPSQDARVGWVHACRHTHLHGIPFVIDEARRDRIFAKEVVEA